MDYNILIGNILESDKELFFGPLEVGEKFIEYPEEIRWPQILKDCGVFKSTSQARKNNWDKDVEKGFTDIFIGKKNRCQITILKEF